MVVPGFCDPPPPPPADELEIKVDVLPLVPAAFGAVPLAPAPPPPTVTG